MDNTFDYGLTKISLNTNWGEKVKSSDWTLDQAKKVKEDKSAYTKFYCATEEGDLLYSDWYQEKSSEEKGMSILSECPRLVSLPFEPTTASRVEVAFPYHFGPMNDLQRSPFFPDILLSVGGWSFHIWKEKVLEGPLLTSAPSVAYLTSGKWSPTRPGVFYLSRADGVVEIWDLLDRSHLPSHIQNVSSTAISYMSINSYQSKGHATTRQFVATGDDDGTLHILEVPRNLTKTVKNEKSFVRAFFDREVKRLNYVKQRVALRIKEKSSMEQTPGHAASDIKVRSNESPWFKFLIEFHTHHGSPISEDQRRSEVGQLGSITEPQLSRIAVAAARSMTLATAGLSRKTLKPKRLSLTFSKWKSHFWSCLEVLPLLAERFPFLNTQYTVTNQEGAITCDCVLRCDEASHGAI